VVFGVRLEDVFRKDFGDGSFATSLGPKQVRPQQGDRLFGSAPGISEETDIGVIVAVRNWGKGRGKPVGFKRLQDGFDLLWGKPFDWPLYSFGQLGFEFGFGQVQPDGWLQ